MIGLKTKSKSEQAKESLRELLSSGQYKKGDRFFSDHKLAKELGLSHVTSSKIAKELVVEGLLYRIKGKGTFVKKSFSGVFTSVSSPVAIIAPEFDLHDSDPNLITAQILSTFENELSLHHLSCRMCPLTSVETISDFIKKHKIKHGIIAGLGRDEQLYKEVLNFLKSLKDSDINLTILNSPELPGLDTIGYDQEWLGRTAVEYFISKGCKDLKLLSYSIDYEWIQSRTKGIADAVKRFRRNGEVNFESIELPHMNLKDQVETLDNITCALSLKKYGVICIHDNLASALHSAAQRKNLQIPEGLAIIGMDDFYMHRYKNITTFQLSGRELGITAARRILSRLEGEDIPIENLLLKCPFLIRSTA